MAKIVITVEDKLDGGVSVVSDPNFDTMMRGKVSGQLDLTAAHGYAICALNAILEASKKQNPKIDIKIPRLVK